MLCCASASFCSSSSDELHGGDEWQQARDDVTGRELITEMVREFRKEEIEYFREMKVYMKVPISECKRVTSKGPIGVRWVDVNKEDELNPSYRSRIVVKEDNTHAMPEMYAATPPLEAEGRGAVRSEEGAGARNNKQNLHRRLGKTIYG